MYRDRENDNINWERINALAALPPEILDKMIEEAERDVINRMKK